MHILKIEHPAPDFDALDAWPIPRRSGASWPSWLGDGSSYVTETTFFADGGLMQSPGL